MADDTRGPGADDGRAVHPSTGSPRDTCPSRTQHARRRSPRCPAAVFTSDYAGTLDAPDTQTGKTLWNQATPAGINSLPAVDGDTLLVGSAAAGFAKKPKFQLIAYSLS